MNRFLCLSFLLIQFALNGQPFKFDFGKGKPANGFTKITTGSFYSPETGYGFEYSSNLIAVKSGHTGTFKDDFITSARPFYFSVRLPEGNYLVKLTVGDAQGTSETTVKAECRRLMLEKVITRQGKFKKINLMVHIRDSLIRGAKPSQVKLKPRERDFLHWDDKLTLEFNNTAPKICALEITRSDDVPTIFLAGNSTVVDQAYEPWAAWGQMFPAFLMSKVAVANYAESGETLKAFEGERRLEKIWSMAKPGDYLFIEFAHNDQKPGGNHLDPFTTYKQTLKEWIDEARKRKMTPVLVTSMHRRRFDENGQIINTLGDYPEAMRQTGKEENVTVIDLNAMSKIMYEAWAPQKSLSAFVHFPANTFPNQPEALKDDTHFSTYGAYELAKCVVQALQKSTLPLKNFIRKDFNVFDPSKPDKFEEFQIPASSFRGGVKPDGN
jgi:lysophospholipase L1-like esterase